MNEFVAGQRWISDTELQMGLGTVLSVDHRSVTIVFMSTGETRIYAQQTAPLTRVRFAPGDTVKSCDGWELHIDNVEEIDGILVYCGIDENGNDNVLDESKLDNYIQLNRPADRLMTGQVDADKWFELRYLTRQHQNTLSHSELRGLAGGRTSFIPHQLYIAHEVANRYAPRVLLADEVGLGKTIEAGLILHHQLITERAQRVLIIVPESLVHQWLVEMLRRFNLHFSIFDEERIQAIESDRSEENPFQTEQLVLCSQDFLSEYPERFQQALSGNWDLLVVDEAHHLQWSEDHASPEYEMVAQLAKVTPGVLLLTATPEQLGKASHFARLRLLDADRFPSYQSFIEEEQSYQPIADAIEHLLNDESFDSQTQATLLQTLDEGDNAELISLVKAHSKANDEQRQQARTELIEHLLDRHGTGRVLFRNTRATVKGFPQRELTAYPLELPEPYRLCLQQFQDSSLSEPALLLSPEILYHSNKEFITKAWTDIDPRVDWLQTRLKALKPEKVLVITASANSALDLADYLRVKQGIHAAVFHEGMSIIERDRAAAYFADPEYGTQVLICSEIGSEGRNFQFAHHLVLFDLPLNPDLLEQRIGRLDRIGQTETIRIHVPYLQNSAQEILYHWYHQALNAFEHTCPAGPAVFQKVQSDLLDALHQLEAGLADIDALIETSKSIHNQLNENLHNGRDRLLEYNSCRPHVANELKQQLQEIEKHNLLPDYLEAVFDCFGIDSEYHGENSLVIRPSDHMQTSHFPGLSSEGMTITYSRESALVHEDMHFLTWEHPLVTGAMDLITSNERGNTAFSVIKYKHAKPGTMLMECLFILDSASHQKSQSQRYLPPSIIRTVIDFNGKDHSTTLSHESIAATRQHIKRETAKTIITTHASHIRDMLNTSTELAQKQAPQMINKAYEQVKKTLEKEINRLNALREVNPNIREDEIDYFKKQWQALDDTLQHASIRLDALRLVIAS